MSLPNSLTVSRILLTPVFVYYFALGRTGVAAVVFLVASLTDFLDGFIARRRGDESDFGRIADPIADKALTGSALVGLSIRGALPWWVTLVILGRELIVTAVRLAVVRRRVVAASRGGKVKTVSQILAITLLLLYPEHTAVTATAVAVAVTLTVATGVDYFWRVRLWQAVPE